MRVKVVAMATMIAAGRSPGAGGTAGVTDARLSKLVAQAYVSRMRSRRFLHTLDNGLLVIAAIVVAVIAFKVLGALVGFSLGYLAAKIAIVTLVVAGVWRAVNGRHHELDGRRRRPRAATARQDRHASGVSAAEHVAGRSSGR